MMDFIRQGIAYIENGQPQQGRNMLLSALNSQRLQPSLQAKLLLWVAKTHDDIDEKLKFIRQASQRDPSNPIVIRHLNYYTNLANPPGAVPGFNRNQSGDNRAQTASSRGSRRIIPPNEDPGFFSDITEDNETSISNMDPDRIQERLRRRPPEMPHIERAGAFVRRRGNFVTDDPEWWEDESINYIGENRIWITASDGSDSVRVSREDAKPPVSLKEDDQPHRWFWYIVIWIAGFATASLLTGAFIKTNTVVFDLLLESTAVLLTILILERRATRRAIVELKKRLIWQAGSRSNEAAKAAIDRMRVEGWLTGKSLLAGQTMPRSNLEEAYLKDANLSGTNFELSNFKNANLGNVNLSHCKLNGSFLMGARLVNANMQHAKLRGADLTGADLTGADFGGADIRGAILTNTINANLRGAIRN